MVNNSFLQKKKKNPYTPHKQQEKKKKKKMGIIAICDIAVTMTSIVVQLELEQIGTYTSVTCAAFEPGMPVVDPDTTASFVEDEIAGEFVGVNFVTMPIITEDYLGNPLLPSHTYNIHCLVLEIFQMVDTRRHIIATEITTNDATCTSGVTLINPTTGARNELISTERITDSALDLGHTKYFSFPHNVHGLNVFEFPRPLPGNTQIEITCCEFEECVFWLSLYKCKHCTGERPLGLSHELTVRGWDSGVCSPKFDNGHSTTAFHKSYNANGGKIVETIHSQYDEIAVMFGIEGAVRDPWCFKSHGPHSAGANCGEKCPPEFSTP